MARASIETAGSRRILTAGFAVLGATTGAAFGRLFQGGATSWKLLAAGAGAALLASALERRSIALAVLASAAGLTLAVVLLVAPETTFYGIPTTESLRSIARALGRAGQQAAEESTPAVPLASLVIASLVAVWCAVTAAHALAVRAAAPFLSLFPPAALVAFADHLAEDGVRPGYTLAFTGACVAVLLGASMRRVQAWGPLIARTGEGAPLARIGSMARGGGTGALVVALAVPWILPGHRSPAIVNLSGKSSRVTIDTIVDIRPNLRRNPAVPLFRVRARRPAYWRMVALDRFDGRRWQTHDPEGTVGQVVAGEQPLTSIPIDAQVLDQRFEILKLGTPWLPAAYQASAVSLGRNRARFDTDRGSLAIPGGMPEGLRYRVTSRLLVPTSDDLRRASGNADPTGFGTTRALPPNVPPRIYRIAHELTADAPTPYEKIIAIQQHLRSFRYDLSARPGHTVNDILFFLERSRRGYCEQFAGTMAVLLRALGYSARVAVGFAPGHRTADGSFLVTTKEAHAWTEVYFRGYGWLAFEPTPARTNPVALDYTNPPAAVAGVPVTQGEVALTQDGGTPQREAAERAAAAAERAASGEGTNTGPPVGPIALAVLAGIVALGALRPLRRRLMLGRARTPRARAIAPYGALAALAHDLGLGRRPGETLQEHLQRMSERVDASDLAALGDPAGRALYAEGPVDAAESDRARAALPRAARQLRRAAGARRSLLALYGLSPRRRSP